MITETLKWIKPSEYMPTHSTNLLGVFNILGSTRHICKCYFDNDEGWINVDFRDETAESIYWCYEPMGPP